MKDMDRMAILVAAGILVISAIYAGRDLLSSDTPKNIVKEENRIEQIDLGSKSEHEVEAMIAFAKNFDDMGQRIGVISSEFLGVKYNDKTLGGELGQKEKLIINFNEMDCFTFLDYVLAIANAESFTDFKVKLQDIRYKTDELSYISRNHFFTDWIQDNAKYVTDITRELGKENVRSEAKLLNQKKDGSNYIDGLRVVRREVFYVPYERIEADLLDDLKTGDLIGLYSYEAGLDVSHVGIVIKTPEDTFFRNASSYQKNMEVLDEYLSEYLYRERNGIVVLRPNSI